MGHSLIGFFVIVILYLVVGLMAAIGTICITRKILAAKAEQAFYAIFLIMIAAFYLAFVAYFGDSAARRLESAVVVAFAVLGVLGVRWPFALILGYPLHGLWDLMHELQAHGVFSFDLGPLTSIPLAYGIFCAAYDFSVAAYLYSRRAAWGDSWKPRPR
jgi:hypothetical protein